MRTLLYKLNQKIFSFKTTLSFPELRVAYAIKSHLTAEERLALFKLAKGKKVVVEIGSYLGASATCFGAAVVNDSEARVFCIDTWNNDAMTEGKMDTFSIFSSNTAPFRQVIRPVRGFSTEVTSQIKSETDHIDLLFIDGDHSYEGAKADWESYKDFLKPGAVVAFHDIGWATGVQKVVEEVKPFCRNFDRLPNLWWAEIGTRP